MKIIDSKNIGVIKGHNRIIEECETSHLVFFDPDDELMPEYLRGAEFLFLNNRALESVFPNILVPKGERLETWITGPFETKPLLSLNTIPMSAVCSMKLFKDLGGYSSDFDGGYEDWDFWVRAALSGAAAGHLNSIEFRYFSKELSRSSSAEIMRHSLIKKLANEWS